MEKQDRSGKLERLLVVEKVLESYYIEYNRIYI